MRRGLHIAISIILLAVLVVAVHYYIGWLKLLEPWLELSLPALLVAILLTFVSYAVRGLRIYHYFIQTVSGRWLACIRLTLLHGLFNNFLPMRSGELSFPVLMSQQFNISARLSLPALAWFRVLDLHTLGLLAGVALVQPRWGNVVTVVLAVAWLLVPGALMMFSRQMQRGLQLYDTTWAQYLYQVLQGLPHDRMVFYRTWLWTMLNWWVKLAVFAYVLMQFTVMTGETALLGAIAGDLTSILPVHGIAGAGTYEAGVVAILVPSGINAADALQAAVNLHLFILGSTVAGGIISLMLPRR